MTIECRWKTAKSLKGKRVLIMTKIDRANCSSVKLLPGSPFYERAEVDHRYLLSLKDEYLLQNYYMEAGILGTRGFWGDSSYHKGWEDPTCQLRGHFLGHWLSAACHMYLLTADPRLKGRVEYIISELERCQTRNGNGWVGSIPEKYLDWVVQKKAVWAPHYTLHKILMGLIDVARLLSNSQALNVANRFAEWFIRWSTQYEGESMQDILDVETGGMMEAFGDLYALTENRRHLELMKKYEHKRVFDELLKGEDVLTNKHMNTTIPEIHGVCRAYELTGEQRYLDIMKTYWEQAVSEREGYITGGQSLGEIWTPKHNLDARLGHKAQEHCTVYNMIRFADYMYCVTNEAKYHDYIERNLYNGVLAQCFWQGYGDDYGHHSSLSQGIKSTTVSYFLANSPGVRKIWSSETESFFCCHGTAIQACSMFNKFIFYASTRTLLINQYIPAVFSENGINVEMSRDPLTECTQRPDFWRFNIKVSGGAFELRLRVPSWIVKAPSIYIDGKSVSFESNNKYIALSNVWNGQTVKVDFKFAITAEQLAGSNRYAFKEGPIALVGLIDAEIPLKGSPEHPERIIYPHEEREWKLWNNFFITKAQERNVEFKYLYEIYNETYTTYFPFSTQ